MKIWEIFLDINMGCLVSLGKQYVEVSTNLDFKAYYVSAVPGQSLMCDQVRNRVGS